MFTDVDKCGKWILDYFFVFMKEREWTLSNIFLNYVLYLWRSNAGNLQIQPAPPIHYPSLQTGKPTTSITTSRSNHHVMSEPTVNPSQVTIISNNPSTTLTTSSGDGDMSLTLDAEISELHMENARVDAQMQRLKSDICAMETQLSTTTGERVSKIFKAIT